MGAGGRADGERCVPQGAGVVGAPGRPAEDKGPVAGIAPDAKGGTVAAVAGNGTVAAAAGVGPSSPCAEEPELAPPPVHVPRPYARPRARLAARVDVPTPDGARIATWVYAPEDAGPATAADPAADLAADLAALVGDPACPPVLVLHGNGEEHGIFGPVIDAVTASGRAVVAVDSRAQGASTRGAVPLSYELMAADAACALDAVGAPRAHVLGFSDGAILGLLLARDRPARVLTLTALGANLTPEGLAPEDLEAMAAAAAANRAWAEGGREGVLLEDGTPIPSPAEAAQIAELLELMVHEPQIEAASLGAIGCPTTVMAGELDDILPDETTRIAAAIPGARLVIVPGADHSLPKVAPEAVARELLATIAQRPR